MKRTEADEILKYLPLLTNPKDAFMGESLHAFGMQS